MAGHRKNCKDGGIDEKLFKIMEVELKAFQTKEVPHHRAIAHKTKTHTGAPCEAVKGKIWTPRAWAKKRRQGKGNAGHLYRKGRNNRQAQPKNRESIHHVN